MVHPVIFIYRIVFIAISLLISCALFAQKETQNVIDSLSSQLKNITGEPKLETLAKLVELELFSPNLITRLNDLEKEAKKQKDSRFLLLSYNYKITYYIRVVDYDSISMYTKLSAPITKRLDPTDDIVAKNEFLKAIGYTARGLFDLALMNQKKYLERIEVVENIKPYMLYAIYIGIGDTYYHQEKYEEALKYFNQANVLVVTMDNNTINQISILSLIALCHADLKNYKTAIEFCDSVRAVMSNNQKEITPESRSYLGFIVDLIAIRAYSKQNDFVKAKALIDQLPFDFEAPFYQDQKAYYYSALSTYYSSIGQYNQALKYNDIGLDELRKDNDIINQPAFIKEKASLLYNMLNYQEAYGKLLLATQITDSIRNSHSAIQLDELSTMYEVVIKDAEIAKAKAQLRFTQTIIIALFAISILLLFILMVVKANSKKQDTKNKVLFKQQEELSQSIAYYKKMILNEVSRNTTNTNVLFQQVEDYMIKDEAYKIPNISRDDVAAILSTNRQYLSSAIKEATGLTFTNYINKYRLENARKQLLDNDDVVIDDIIIEAGFSSRPTFHRLFKERYGMAPYELKRAAIALQNEILRDEKENE